MNNHNAKYAFYYLLSLVSLIFTAISVALISFQIINRNFVDDLYSGPAIYDGQLRFAISALLIASPVLLLMLRLINQGLKKKELDPNSGLRRWLTYFILLVSAVIILGSLIGVINQYLSGEMTVRFILQALTVLVIAALVFSYYLYDIKRDNFITKNWLMTAFLAGTLTLLILSLVAAFLTVESPQMARQRKIDQQTMSNIYQLENEINSFYQENKRLPESLEELTATNRLRSPYSISPLIFEQIEYQKISDEQFNLCANFVTDSRLEKRDYYFETGRMNQAGWNCFPGNLWLDVKAPTIELVPTPIITSETEVD